VRYADESDGLEIELEQPCCSRTVELLEAELPHGCFDRISLGRRSPPTEEHNPRPPTMHKHDPLHSCVRQRGKLAAQSVEIQLRAVCVNAGDRDSTLISQSLDGIWAKEQRYVVTESDLQNVWNR
jgi:hypothetical protein